MISHFWEMQFLQIYFLLWGTLLHFIVTHAGIIGGEPAQHFPFFVTVRAQMLPSCGGSIVAPQAVLTAALCLFDFTLQNWVPREEVYVTKSNFAQKYWREDARWFWSQHYISHQSYRLQVNDGLVPFDVAIFKLYESIAISEWQPQIIEPCPDSSYFNEGLVIGMGLTSRHPDIEAKFLMGVSLHRHYGCARFFDSHGVEIDEENQVCFESVSMTIPAGICEGDSGGPFVAYSTTNN